MLEKLILKWHNVPIISKQISKLTLLVNQMLQWCALENQQSPFYVVNEVTLTRQNPSLKFSELKDLNLFSTVPKVQEASKVLRMGFALSK